MVNFLSAGTQGGRRTLSTRQGRTRRCGCRCQSSWCCGKKCRGRSRRGATELGQGRLRPGLKNTVLGPADLGLVLKHHLVWVAEGWGPNPDKSGARWVGPGRWGPEGWGGPKFRAFFPLPPPSFRSLFLSLEVFSCFVSLWSVVSCLFSLSGGLLVFFCLSLGVVSWNLMVFLKAWTLKMCTFEPLGCRVKVQAPLH